MNETLLQIAQQAKDTFYHFTSVHSDQKNQALNCIAESITYHKKSILDANLADLKLAEENHVPPHMIDRLSLQGHRLDQIIKDIFHIRDLKDPINEIIESTTLENGLRLIKKRVPLGVLGIIYEARPNVTVDVACLSIKTGNVAILRGGSETLNSNSILVTAIQEGLQKANLSKNIIQLIESRDRHLIAELLKLNAFVDVIIPRGGAGLHRYCVENSTIPVITGGIGICHLFVDESADLQKSIPVIVNAKVQRPTVCNALDTLLVHKKIANAFLPQLINTLLEHKVHFRLDSKAWNEVQPIIHQHPSFFKVAEIDDWDKEWLELILGIKVVSDLEEALEHIHQHGSKHSDGILTENKHNANEFVHRVDSAAVYINSSTRFTDGGEFGLGAEVAVSTQKLHARGPMGLKELTTYKWIVEGDYHFRK